MGTCLDKARCLLAEFIAREVAGWTKDDMEEKLETDHRRTMVGAFRAEVHNLSWPRTAMYHFQCTRGPKTKSLAELSRAKYNLFLFYKPFHRLWFDIIS